MSEPTYEGACLCGDVRYRVSGTGTNVCYCHCRSCRGSSGAPFVAWATFEKARFEIIAGAPAHNASSAHVRRSFCGRCGTALTYEHDARPEHIDVTLATLHDAGDMRPQAHIWIAHKLPWVTLADGLAQHAGWAKLES